VKQHLRLNLEPHAQALLLMVEEMVAVVLLAAAELEATQEMVEQENPLDLMVVMAQAVAVEEDLPQTEPEVAMVVVEE